MNFSEVFIRRPVMTVLLSASAVVAGVLAYDDIPIAALPKFETPTIRAMDERYRDQGLVIVAVQVQQTVQAGREYAERYGLRYRIGADVTGAIFHTYHVFALPTQFFIDPNGVLRQIVNGPLSETRASQLIEAILPPAQSGVPRSSAAPSSTQ